MPEVTIVPMSTRLSYNKFGGQPVSLAIGGRWYPETPRFGPDWGIRAVATFLFPTGGH